MRQALVALLLPAATAAVPPTCGWQSFPKAINNTLCFGFKELYGKGGSKLTSGEACEAACCQDPHCNHWQFGASKPPSKFDGCWEWVDPKPPSSCTPRLGWNGRSGRPAVPPPPPPPPPSPPVSHGPWKDPTLPIEKRLADLLPRLSEDFLSCPTLLDRSSTRRSTSLGKSVSQGSTALGSGRRALRVSRPFQLQRFLTL